MTLACASIDSTKMSRDPTRKEVSEIMKYKDDNIVHLVGRDNLYIVNIVLLSSNFLTLFSIKFLLCCSWSTVRAPCDLARTRSLGEQASYPPLHI